MGKKGWRLRKVTKGEEEIFACWSPLRGVNKLGSVSRLKERLDHDSLEVKVNPLRRFFCSFTPLGFCHSDLSHYAALHSRLVLFIWIYICAQRIPSIYLSTYPSVFSVWLQWAQTLQWAKHRNHSSVPWLWFGGHGVKRIRFRMACAHHYSWEGRGILKAHRNCAYDIPPPGLLPVFLLVLLCCSNLFICQNQRFPRWWVYVCVCVGVWVSL